jgi:hypothetical protein
MVTTFGSTLADACASPGASLPASEASGRLRSQVAKQRDDMKSRPRAARVAQA